MKYPSRAEDSEILSLQFECGAEHARQRGKPKRGDCFDTLASSVGSVSDELLNAYFEMFQDVTEGELDGELMQSIHQGWWSPASATEYIERFIAMASGTDGQP